MFKDMHNSILKTLYLPLKEKVGSKYWKQIVSALFCIYLC